MENKINLGQLVFNDLEHNPYLNKIYNTLLTHYSEKVIFGSTETPNIELSDALRFADLLSKSTSDTKKDYQKQLGQELITLINELYPNNDVIKQFLGSVLVSNGNYPSVKMNLKTYKNYDDIENIIDTINMNDHLIPGTNNEFFSVNQKEVFNHFEDDSFSYSGPTSMGKSFLIRHFIREKVKNHSSSNFVFIVPTNALINELSTSIHNDLKDVLRENNYRIITITESIFLQQQNNHFIFVLTPERLLYLLMNHRNLIIDYLFIDEAHKLITADGRSSYYYKVVDFLTRRKNVKVPKIIFSSPNIKNPQLFQKTIKDTNIQFTNKSFKQSPVNQFKFVVDFHNKRTSIYNTIENRISEPRQFNGNVSLNDLILAQSNMNDADLNNRKNTIVYCSSISKAISYAQSFYDSLPAATNIPKELRDFSKELKEEISEYYFLAEFIQKGVAYHVGYLPNKIRVKLEKLFRDKIISVMFCTSTLIEGVNFPAENLFVTSNKAGLSNLSKIDFKNLIGRVGRLQYNIFGNVFLVNDTNNEKLLKDYDEYLTKDTKDEEKLSISSGIHPKDREFIVNLLLQGKTSFEYKECRSSQTRSEYELMQKVVNILLRDILKDHNSVIVDEFKTLLEGKVDQIKKVFEKSAEHLDDDINISSDQVLSLREWIESGRLKYPALTIHDEGIKDEIILFLEKFAKAFKWDKLENKRWVGEADANGKHNKFKYYATMLLKWIRGNGMYFITSSSIDFYDKYGGLVLENGYEWKEYDGTRYHKNLVIASTLETIENIILFHINNYCIKFTKEYKKIFPNDDEFVDWQEFIEFGSTDKNNIYLQKTGLSRETTLYLKDNNYVQPRFPQVKGKTPIIILPSIFECKNQSVIEECELLKINMPEIFEE